MICHLLQKRRETKKTRTSDNVAFYCSKNCLQQFPKSKCRCQMVSNLIPKKKSGEDVSMVCVSEKTEEVRKKGFRVEDKKMAKKPKRIQEAYRKLCLFIF